ncbi:MAG: putative metal-binding motif-containing protein [Pseudomonadota bacterium]|nr:putative metal-binding motif-containing protein [Pseudomonadota bacterium]
MRPLTSTLTFLLLSACSSKWTPLDVDGDGYTVATGDCWENEVGPNGLSSADIHPGAVETWYDGFDQDCSGGNDFDKDGDGHASISFPDPEGLLPSDDCWDDPDVLPGAFAADDPADQLTADLVSPEAVETWYDGVDQNCAGDDDFDQDGDGFASAAHPDGTDEGDDCFDGADDDFVNDGGLDPADVNPDASDEWYDGTDADCEGNDDYDQDRDGYARDLECDDLDATRFPDPSVPEVWYDGLDDNCDGNDGDKDGDGYYVAGYAFEIPVAYQPDDCWDDPAAGASWVPLNGLEAFDADQAHPGATETWYDGLDQDCAGDDDFDQDLDGFRTLAYTNESGLVGDDCDDLLATTNPAATETWYDDVDADCAGDDDFDQDHDSYATDTDCDDTAASVNPGALEACGNAVDEDCSGSDNDEGAFGCTDYYADTDADGFGSDTGMCLCQAEGDYTETSAGDCDDGDATVNPDGIESCSTAADDDCDGSTNAIGAVGCDDWYVDADGDTYGATASQCSCDATGLYTADNSDDCNDLVATVNPSRTETCNDIDDDCDSSVDEGLTLYYADVDGDSYGAGTGDCTTGATLVTNDDDCNDDAEKVYPGATEYCDGEANDCTTAASWTSADEDEMVTYINTLDVWSDVSASFTATAGNYNIESGTYNFCAGTYYTKLVGSSDTTDIVGIYGADETTLENNGTAGATVTVVAGSVTLTGFTVTGGKGSGSTGNTFGGGILGSITGTTPATTPHLIVEDCIVTGNTATNGGGVASYLSGWVKLVNTTVEGNTSTGTSTGSGGGGLYSYLGADFTLEGTTVTGNTANDGGGIFVDDGTLLMTDSYVVANTATDDGAGLFIDTGTATCTDGGVYDNTATDHGGGVYLSNDGSSTARFTAVRCDFGTAALDNAPNDVEVKTAGSDYELYTSYSATASFVCSNATDLCI